MRGHMHDGEGAYGTLSVFIRKTWKDGPSKKDKEYEMAERLEERIPVRNLVNDRKASDAAVTASVSTKVSDSVHYAEGTWDKIPYSVEVFSSVTLQCDQDADTIRAAHNMAYDLAWDASREHLGKAMMGHVTDIRTRLYEERFNA